VKDRALLLDLSLRKTGFAVVSWPPTFDEETDLYLYGDNILFKGELPLERADLSIQERVGTLALLLSQLVEWWNPIFIAAEMPTNMYQARPGGKSVSSAASVIQQQRAFGAAMAEFWALGVPFIEVDPAQSKTALTGKRTASKDLVKEYLAIRMGAKLSTGEYRWPKGVTEAVRDALAVLWFLDYRYRLYPDGDWLDRLLKEQHKPTVAEHRSRRGMSFVDLQSEAVARNKPDVRTKSSVRRKKRTAIP
jgi:Holliday junction resolvasome RuvABC endonuclease subunit